MKEGHDYSNLGFFFLILSLVYITYVIPTLSHSSNTIFQSIMLNEIDSSNVLFIVIFTTFAIFDGVINRKFSNDKIGLSRENILFEKLRDMNIELKDDTLFMKPVERFQRAFRKLVAVFKMRKAIKTKEDPVADNPLKRKFYLMIIFWIMLHILVYFHLTVLSNPDQNKSALEVIANFFSDPQMRDSRAWVEIRIFYFLSIVYIYVNIIQIHSGKKIFSSCVIRWTTLDNATLKASDFTPLFREMGVVMDFQANQSALRLTHKLTYNDVLYNIRNAKAEQKKRNEASFGTYQKPIIKVGVALIWFCLVIVIVFGPLLPFTSWFNENAPVYIKDASFKVSFADHTGREIGLMYQTKSNFQNHTEQKTRPFFNEYIKVKNGMDHEKYSPNMFEILSLSKASDSRATLEDRFFEVKNSKSKQYIYKEILRGSLILTIQVEVR